MTTPIPPDDIRSLWQSQPTTELTISAAEMRERANTFQERIRRRNRVEYIACAVVIAAFSWYATWPKPATPLWPIANLLIIAGVLLIAFNLHRYGRAAPVPPTPPVIDFTAAPRGLFAPLARSLRLFAWSLQKRFAAHPAATPDTTSVASLIDFHRAELERQRRAALTAWRWYVLPLVPGMTLWFVAFWIGHEPLKSGKIPMAVALTVTAVLVVLTFAYVIARNLRGAARLQNQIDELDRYRKEV